MFGNLTGWDFFVAFCIVAFDEYIIKKLICKGNEKYKAIYTYAPLVLGVAAYIVMALIGHTEILNAILHGLNFEQGTTARERNRQIGGHKA